MGGKVDGGVLSSTVSSVHVGSAQLHNGHVAAGPARRFVSDTTSKSRTWRFVHCPPHHIVAVHITVFSHQARSRRASGVCVLVISRRITWWCHFLLHMQRSLCPRVNSQQVGANQSMKGRGSVFSTWCLTRSRHAQLLHTPSVSTVTLSITSLSSSIAQADMQLNTMGDRLWLTTMSSWNNCGILYWIDRGSLHGHSYVRWRQRTTD